MALEIRIAGTNPTCIKTFRTYPVIIKGIKSYVGLEKFIKKI